jgi:hypothetical protein
MAVVASTSEVMRQDSAVSYCAAPDIPIERYGWIQPMFYSPEDEEELRLDAAFAAATAAVVAANTAAAAAAPVVGGGADGAAATIATAEEKAALAANAQRTQEWTRSNPACPTPHQLFEWQDDPCAAQGISAGGWRTAWDASSMTVPPRPWRGPPLPSAYFRELPSEDYACLLPYALHGENAQELRLQESFSETDEVFLAYCEDYVNRWDEYWEAVIRFVSHRRGARLAHLYDSSDAYRAEADMLGGSRDARPGDAA